MGGGSGMTGGAGSLTRRAGRLPGGGVRRIGRLARLPHGNLPACPGSCLLYRLERAVIRRISGGEKRQYVFGAIGGPGRQQAMVGLIKRSSAAYGHEARISVPYISVLFVHG
jgi:hypothetical protein